MSFSGFTTAPGAWGTNTAWHMFGPIDFDLGQVMAFANERQDNCTVEKLKWDMTDKRFFKVYIKTRKTTYRFHMIFSTKDGKLYRQTIEYDKKTILGNPVEIVIEL